MLSFIVRDAHQLSPPALDPKRLPIAVVSPTITLPRRARQKSAARVRAPTSGTAVRVRSTGAGQDPGPDVSLPHRALAIGGELRGADPATGERAGVRGAGDGARRRSARAADGPGRGARGLGRIGGGGRAAEGGADQGSARVSASNELDRFMAATGRRLGKEGIREASRSAHSGRGMTVQGAGAV